MDNLCTRGTKNTRNICMLGKTIIEEMRAIMDYSVRIDETTDPRVDTLLRHIRAEEAEHLAEALKLIAEIDPGFREAFEKEGFLGKKVTIV